MPDFILYIKTLRINCCALVDEVIVVVRHDVHLDLRLVGEEEVAPILMY